MKMNTFIRPACPTCPDNYNRGEQVEWRVGYELTGQPGERNNKPGAEGGDVLGEQRALREEREIPPQGPL